MTKDLVSIGIPAYKATYLKEAIDSVLNQTYTRKIIKHCLCFISNLHKVRTDHSQ